MDTLKVIVNNIKSKNLDKALKLCEDYNNKENEYLINNFKGVIYSLLNNQKLAEEFFQKSHILNRKFEDPLKNLYIISIKKKNLVNAIKICQKLCVIDDKNDTYYYQLAYAHELNNNNLLALENYEKCINLNGSSQIKALNNVGTLYLRSNKAKSSLKFFLTANKLSKDNKLIINNILLNYIKLKDEKKADEFFLISQKLDAQYLGFIYNEANYYIFKQQYNKAITLLKNHKDKLRFLILLIDLYFNMGNFKEAELLLEERKSEIKSDSNFYNFYGLRLLRVGKFKEGWKLYESRGSKITSYLKDIKDWNGENLDNKSIVVFYEQGIGDTIQFSKYVYSLSKIAKNVCFVVNESIKGLFKSNLKNIKIQTRENFVNDNFTFKISLGSLIKYFYLEKYDRHDYLIAENKNEIKLWKNKMDFSRPNVGLVWTGSFFGPNQPLRSIQLKNITKILELNINYYCLQNEIWESDKEFFNKEKIIDFGNYSLVEIASIIKNLDLVITVDTALLHISSILNKETWGIFNNYPDWRWGALDKINPYKSLVKINQKEFNQWGDVTKEIYDKLKNKFKLN
ncbi:hypothetical protein OAY25_01860 [Candidatus Pelagibacter sp.]|nr:hypothetical protein [Candidatus Pelagibacter sp.]